VANRGKEPSSRSRIPHGCRKILARSYNAAAVWAEGRKQDSITVHQRGTNWPAIGGAPHLGIALGIRLILATANKLRPVTTVFSSVNRLQEFQWRETELACTRIPDFYLVSAYRGKLRGVWSKKGGFDGITVRQNP